MITSIFYISWAIFTFLMSYFIRPLYLIPVWFVAGFLVGLICAIGFILINLYTVLTHTKVLNKYKAYLTKSICFFATHILQGVRLKIKGKENLKNLGHVMVVGNHKSNIDAQIVIEMLKGSVAFTPKKELYNNKLLATYFNAIGCMPVNRENDREVAKEMVKTIKNMKEGLNLVLFPEGGVISRETELMLTMKPGAYKLAFKSEATLLPICIFNSHKLYKKFPLFIPYTIEIHVLKPLKYEDYKNMTTNEVAEYIFNLVNNHIEEFRSTSLINSNLPSL